MMGKNTTKHLIKEIKENFKFESKTFEINIIQRHVIEGLPREQMLK